MCRLDGEDDLSDFMIEIDILTEIKHPNIVELLEAFQKDQQVSLESKCHKHYLLKLNLFIVMAAN